MRGLLVEQFAPELVRWMKQWLGGKGMVSDSRVVCMFKHFKREREEM